MGTPWGEARKILGKSRGSNMIVLGVFFIIIGGIIESGSIPFIAEEAGTTLRNLSIVIIGVGIGLYLREGG